MDAAPQAGRLVARSRWWPRVSRPTLVVLTLGAIGVVGAAVALGSIGRESPAAKADNYRGSEPPARALDALSSAERRDVTAVAISTDPVEDTAEAVRRFLRRNRALGRLLYIGGGQAQSELRSVWSAFDVLSSLESGQDTVHSAPVRIYDRGGTWVATLHVGADLSETNLAHDLRVALSSGG